ncbi:TolC family protein [Caulobacter segnis]
MPTFSLRRSAGPISPSPAPWSWRPAPALPPAQAARVAKAPQAYETAQTLAAPVADWPADAWWTGYGDAQLNALEDEALKGSPSLAAAEGSPAPRPVAGRPGQGRPTCRVSAWAPTWPKTSRATTTASRRPLSRMATTTPAVSPSTSAGSWTSGARTRAAVAAATSEAKAAQADAAQARLTLSTAVASTYAELSRLYAQRDVAEQAVRLRQETSNLVAKRVANGLDTRAESEQAAAGPPASKAEALRPG